MGLVYQADYIEKEKKVWMTQTYNILIPKWEKIPF